MKISQHRSSRSAGFTLIEVTLVVAVLFGLISVLFIGAASYKEGTDRAQCILTISVVQKAVRSYQNLYQLQVGDSIDPQTLVGNNKLLEFLPPCGSQTPSASSDVFAEAGYTKLGAIPGSGTPFISCKTVNLGHAPSASVAW